MSDDYRLLQVFGLWSNIDSPTYVNRASLDEQLQALIEANRIVVIYGESRQGKTILRKRNIPEDRIVAVTCRAGMTAEQIVRDLLAQLGSYVPTQLENSESRGTEFSGEAKGKLGLFGSGAELTGSAVGNLGKEVTRVAQSAGEHNPVSLLLRELKRTNKLVVIDDFHFLPDKDQRDIANVLKPFGDEGVGAVIIGVWTQSGKLTSFNGQLRTREVSVAWSDDELNQVLLLGEKALRIRFSEELRSALVKDAKGSVGLLQMLAEKVCGSSGVDRSQPVPLLGRAPLISIDVLDNARKRVCREELAYIGAAIEKMSRGINTGSGTPKYRDILRACAEHCSDEELLRGVTHGQLRTKIRQFGDAIQNTNIKNAVAQFSALQDKHYVTPHIFSGDPESAEIRLLDKMFLFYRQYSDAPWPWRAAN